MKVYHTSSPKETSELGKKLARIINPGEVILISGELGAGKTTFVKGLAKGLGINEVVKSPTFNIVNIYNGLINLFHIDLYRLEKEDELSDIGLEDYLYKDDSICAIEWGGKFKDLIVSRYISVNIYYEDGNKRRVEMKKKAA